MGRVINVHAAVSGGTQWSTRRSVFLDQMKNHSAASLSLFDLMKGVDSTWMQLHLQVGHLFQLRAFLLPGQSHEKYQLCSKERRSHHFCHVGAGREHPSVTKVGRREAGESRFISGFYKCVSGYLQSEVGAS